MKPALYPIIVIIFAYACSGRHNNTDSSKAVEPTQPAITDPEDTGSINPQDSSRALVWIGLAARWRKAPGEIFDGFYDSTIQYFKLCGQDRPIPVSRNLIDFEEVPNCDTARGGHISLIMMKKDSSTPANGGRLVPVDNVVNGKAVIVRNQGVDSVQLPEKEVRRIKEFRHTRAIENVNKVEMERLRGDLQPN
jgi:hypothetical protein